MLNISIFRTRRISDHLPTKILLVHSEPQGKVSLFYHNLPFTILDPVHRRAGIMYGGTYFPIDYRPRAVTPDFSLTPNLIASIITNFPLTMIAISQMKDSYRLYKKLIVILG